jgi:hypothetical protein
MNVNTPSRTCSPSLRCDCVAASPPGRAAPRAGTDCRTWAGLVGFRRTPGRAEPHRGLARGVATQLVAWPVVAGSASTVVVAKATISAATCVTHASCGDLHTGAGLRHRGVPSMGYSGFRSLSFPVLFGGVSAKSSGAASPRSSGWFDVVVGTVVGAANPRSSGLGGSTASGSGVRSSVDIRNP